MARRQVLLVSNGRCGRAGIYDHFPAALWDEVALLAAEEGYVKPGELAVRARKRAAGSFDGIWCSNAAEHLPIADATLLLAELRRLLKPDGCLVMLATDLESVARVLGDKGLEKPQRLPSGVATPLEMLFDQNWDRPIAPCPVPTRCGFTARSLGIRLGRAGYRDVKVQRRGFRLWGLGYRRDDGSTEFRIDDVGVSNRSGRDRLDQPPEI